MTTLTPFRLFQICKYALQAYTSNSPLLNRTRRIGDAVKGATTGMMLVGKRDRRRSLEEGKVGFGVEERRGWDTKPQPQTQTQTQNQPQGRDEVVRAGTTEGTKSGKSDGEVGTGYDLRIPSGSGSADPGSGRKDKFDLENYRHTPSSSSSSSSSRPSSSSSSSPPPSDPNEEPLRYSNEINRLMLSPVLFTPAFKPPRNVIVLCHGLYGFSTATPIPLFPSLKLHYWHSVLTYLREQLGCKVMVVGVKGTGSIEERAGEMDRWLKDKLPRGTGVNFVAHSMVSTRSPWMNSRGKSR